MPTGRTCKPIQGWFLGWHDGRVECEFADWFFNALPNGEMMRLTKEQLRTSWHKGIMELQRVMQNWYKKGEVWIG